MGGGAQFWGRGTTPLKGHWSRSLVLEDWRGAEHTKRVIKKRGQAFAREKDAKRKRKNERTKKKNPEPGEQQQNKQRKVISVVVAWCTLWQENRGGENEISKNGYGGGGLSVSSEGQ